MMLNDPSPIYRDDGFTATPAVSCALAGYLILEPLEAVESIAELAPSHAASLGPLLGRLSHAIASTTGADRVYCLLFAEEKRAIHFHLFPRTAWLLYAYRTHLGSKTAPVSAPQLFEWARFAYRHDQDLPPGAATWAEVEPSLRSALLRV